MGVGDLPEVINLWGQIISPWVDHQQLVGWVIISWAGLSACETALLYITLHYKVHYFGCSMVGTGYGAWAGVGSWLPLYFCNTPWGWPRVRTQSHSFQPSPLGAGIEAMFKIKDFCSDLTSFPLHGPFHDVIQPTIRLLLSVAQPAANTELLNILFFLSHNISFNYFSRRLGGDLPQLCVPHSTARGGVRCRVPWGLFTDVRGR